MTLEDMIAGVQEKLGVVVDGRAGPQTWAAIHAHIVEPTGRGISSQRVSIDPVDTRSEKHIATLLPEVRPFARALVQKAAQAGIHIKVISGLRTFAEQDALYAQGRTVPGPKITNARAGQSNHNFGIAFDVGVFSGSSYLPESEKYKAVGVLGMDLGLEWGGNWTTIKDAPHYQLRPAWAAGWSERDLLAELKARAATGAAIFTQR